MTTSFSTLGRRAMAVAGAAAVALLGLSPVAAAEDPNYGNIKLTALGSLTIHKHLEGDGTVGTADGEGAREGDQRVAGVQFTAYPITDLDLSDSTHWPTISALAAPGAIPDSACADPNNPTLAGRTVSNSGFTSEDTNVLGQVTISSLPVRAYLVCETKAPSNIVQKAKPFVVTIPHPNAAADGQWIYDVHAYPKNVQITVDKTIDDQRSHGYGLGSFISFPVTSTLPSLDGNAHYKYFRFKDVMSERLSDLEVSAVTLDAVPMTANTDYMVSTNGQTMYVDFTADGLAKLKAAGGKQVTATFSGRVASVADGAIDNTAQLITDTVYADTPPTPQTPPENPDNPPTTPEVTSRWGIINISKVDANAQQGPAGLGGAEFQVYNSDQPYADDCSSVNKTGDPLMVGGTNTFTTNNDGSLTIPGLFVSDSVTVAGRDNNAAATHRCYVIVETKAPAGYVLPDAATASRAVRVEVGENNAHLQQIENTKHSVPNLPLTGAAGKVLLTVAGASLLMVAVGSVLVSRYRERKRAGL